MSRLRNYSPGVRVKEVSFETLQCDKRKARAEDARRLAQGLATPEQLQEENSPIPLHSKITIVNLRETLERYYGK